MYTDGLLKESRGYGDTEAHTGRLLDSLNQAGPALEDICDRVADTLPPGGPHDDVALLLARVHALPRGPGGVLGSFRPSPRPRPGPGS